MQTQVSVEIIEKIQKLLALGQSPNENEAKLAVSRAQELLLKYNLKMSEITNDGGETPVEEQVIDKMGHIANWKLNLLEHISKHNFCTVLLRTETRGSNVRYCLIGKAFNIDIVNSMYKYLIDAIERLARSEVSKEEVYEAYGRFTPRARNSFKLGAAKRIGERLEEIRLMEDNEGVDMNGDGHCTALVVRNLREHELALNEAYLNRLQDRSQKMTRSVFNPDFFGMGYDAGNKIGLNKQLEKNNSKTIK